MKTNKNKEDLLNPNYFFCPNPRCPYSRQFHFDSRWYIKDGFHATKAFGLVQRYRCKHCGKTFSDQTFSLNYYLKKYTDFTALLPQLICNNSDCFIGRHNDLSFESVRIRRDRMARNALYFQSTLMEGVKISEPLAADGFESYTRSKYYPVNINILTGADSRFLYYFTESHSRRKGAVSDAQKRRMDYEYLGKDFSGCSTVAQFESLIGYLAGRCGEEPVVLHTDEHPAYPQALKRLAGRAGFPAVSHQRTSSRAVRDAGNPLASVNYMDMLFRKDIPNHRRRTICHARNDRNMLARVALYMATHNFFKPRSITDKAAQTAERHYEDLGVSQQKLRFWKELFSTERLFLSKVQLPEYFLKVWTRKTETPFGENWYPLPKFALQ
jgi:hypothetical protein